MSAPHDDRFHGVSPVLYAFWDQNGRLDVDLMQEQVRQCQQAGAHGITVLGLVSEVHRMDREERRQFVEVVGRANNGALPYSVTVGEPSVHGQVDACRHAADIGADWVILQPPPTKGIPAQELEAFFAAVADRSPIPVAIQNNPINLDVFLPNDALVRLARMNPKIVLMKGEGPAISVAQLAEDGRDSFGVFAGHGGVELTMNLESGCVGLIPAPELVDVQVSVYEGLTSSDPAVYERAYLRHTQVLPWIVMMTRSGVEFMIHYGKRLMAQRMGVAEPYARAPAPKGNRAGDAALEFMAARLGKIARIEDRQTHELTQ